MIVDGEGISVVDTRADADRDFSTRPEFMTALLGERSVGIRRSDTLDTDLLYVAVPVASGGTVHGAIRITLDTHDVDERVRRFWWGLAAIAVVVLLAVAVSGWLLARSVTRPVRRLQHAANRFSEGDLTPTTPDPHAPPELADLEATLNSMAVRLDALITSQRAFVADASHQLRTPLTALRLRLENIGSMTHDPAEEAEIERAIDETTRLASLVGELLQLARAERTDAPASADLVALTRDRVDTWSTVAEQAGVELAVDAPASELLVSAVPGGVEQVLDNLLDNAIRAAPTGTTVRATVTAGTTRHELAIVDQGAGLSPDDRRHALERFWQADTTSPGSGLGLSIVQSIVEASGGTISLDANAPTGLIVRIELPAIASRGERRGGSVAETARTEV